MILRRLIPGSSRISPRIPAPQPDPRDLVGNVAAFDSMPKWMTR